MKTIKIAALTLLALLAVATIVAYSGVVNVAASESHSGPVNWFLETTMRASIKRRAAEIEVPNLDDEYLQRAGINDFDAMCAGCHGAPGRDPEAMGQGLNPAAPDLGAVAAARTAGELYWVTKHGIRMTAMPAWGASHDDQSLWPVVAFMKERLPELDAAGYGALLESSAGAGHHGASSDAHAEHGHDDRPGSSHGTGDTAAQGDAADSGTASETHDHSTHEH